jgi:hypothetical protein
MKTTLIRGASIGWTLFKWFTVTFSDKPSEKPCRLFEKAVWLPDTDQNYLNCDWSAVLGAGRRQGRIDKRSIRELCSMETRQRVSVRRKSIVGSQNNVVLLSAQIKQNKSGLTVFLKLSRAHQPKAQSRAINKLIFWFQSHYFEK